MEKPTQKQSRKRRVSEVAEEPNNDGPYSTFKGPTSDVVRAVHRGLSLLHPEVIERVRAQRSTAKKEDGGSCGSRKYVLDALVGTILSQNTTDVNSHRAFASLKEAFPTWEEVRAAPAAKVEEAIRAGGLAAIKTGRIHVILETVYAERGELSLEYLREMSDEEVKKTLLRFKGVGAKTVSCVLLFCLGRDDFPVDTHVWKIALALNWVPKSADRDGTYEHLNRRVPNEIKYELHVLLVEHGKQYKNDVKLLKEFNRAASASSAAAVEEPILEEPTPAGKRDVASDKKPKIEEEDVKPRLVD